MTRELTWREALVAAASGIVLAVVMTWPLVLHLGSDIGKDLGDPLLQTWQVAWIGHALLHAPGDLWQANTFWPYDDTLAFSDALVGYAPVALVAQASPHAALLGYNVLFLFAYALAFLGAYLLARELGIGWPGAAAAGAAFAYAPWKLSQNGHLHVLSSGGIPLALFLLLRGYRRRSPGTVVAGWLVAAWQMTLGFTLGLQLAYLLLVLAVVFLVGVWRSWLPRPGRRVLIATAFGLIAYVSCPASWHGRTCASSTRTRRPVGRCRTCSPSRRASPELPFGAGGELGLGWRDVARPSTVASARRGVAVPRACGFRARAVRRLRIGSLAKATDRPRGRRGDLRAPLARRA